MDKLYRILIVDDHPTVREGLKAILYTHPNFDIIGEAADGLEAVNFVERFLPDLVLMDLSMPRMGGLDATREIKKKWPETKILVFTNQESPEYRAATSEAGADGYLLKDSPITKLIKSIKDILA
jgi:DNA-binding NarL/FixJ family response regulator